MKRFLFLFISTFFLLPLLANAAADLSISAQDVRFSRPLLVAGDEVRLYAKIYNTGDEDVSGFVSFYQGTTLIDDSLVISLLANGSPEEVYVDFVVPERSFNIMALIRGTDPTDTDTSNDAALTSYYTPVMDDDRDGIENGSDNCPSGTNEDQRDSDGDGEGDACDADDDNDGLTDEVEAELNTNTTDSDSDADGVSVADVAYPNDAHETVLEEEQAVEIVTPPATEAFQKIVEEVAKSIKQTVDETNDQTDQEVQISPHSVFAYTRDAWNTFTFTALTNVSDQAVYIWDFGDGVTSSRQSVQHTYTRSGAFDVTLTVNDQNGTVSSETTIVLVPFFYLKNRLVLILVVLLSVLFLVGVVALRRLARKK